jgi:hypothetical protein
MTKTPLTDKNKFPAFPYYDSQQNIHWTDVVPARICADIEQRLSDLELLVANWLSMDSAPVPADDKERYKWLKFHIGTFMNHKVFDSPELMKKKIRYCQYHMCTCDECEDRNTCECAYDPYNSDGACLAAK